MNQAAVDAVVEQATQPPPRKRTVLTRADRKQVDRAVKILEPAGLAMVLCCRTCNSMMERDGGGGFVCPCQHVVFA